MVFPGSNCDLDVHHAIRLMGQDVSYVWHTETDLSQYDVVILPGGFSYGDYLRVGAIASYSPVMSAIKEFAYQGGLVLGICNGFQILCEAGLLPGALRANEDLSFHCHDIYVRVEDTDTPFSNQLRTGDVLKLPIAHGEGNYFASEEDMKNLRVIFRYSDSQGNRGGNPNGSVDDIAGISNLSGNVLGLMPHPERAMEELLGSRDGRGIFSSIVAYLKERSGISV